MIDKRLDKKEKKLYVLVAKAHAELIDSIKNESRAFYNFMQDTMEVDKTHYKFIRKYGKNFHLIGETHLSFQPVKITHIKIAPLIKKEPKDWLFLFEPDEDESEDFICVPSSFYFQRLSDLYNIPKENVIPAITEPKVKKYIQQKMGINDVELDEIILNSAIGAERRECMEAAELNDTKRIVSVLERASKNYLQKPLEYALKIISMGQTQLSIDDVKPHWNDYAKKDFLNTLKKYSEKRNVLVNVGAGHLEVFL